MSLGYIPKLLKLKNLQAHAEYRLFVNIYERLIQIYEIFATHQQYVGRRN